MENRAVLKILEKLIIMATNLLMYYLIVEVSYIEPLLVTKLIFIDIKFEFSKKTSCNYDSLAKPREKIRSS